LWPKESNSDRVPEGDVARVAPGIRNVKKPTPFGKYYLLERINVGGMAEVFRAKAFGVEGFERLVAVKRILPNIAEDKEFIRMFIEEAKLAVQLNHANIAQIFDLGVVDGSYYIALEHVHGRDLRSMFDRCRQLGDPMPVSQACFVVMKVCEGLDYAHNKRDQSGRELHLVHRDVSPQNVLVSFEGEVKLIDFGIAKAAGKGSKTQAGILKGKFGYMSPEQVRGIPVDRRSDVFSCGIVLYELLTGERLFVGESDFSTLEKVRNVEILPPSTYNRRIPDELERIVLKALAKDPDERYQNAIDLHDELQAFVYTAGEFYSRKDLAGWMKKTFGREIEEETAKLESYRQLKAPASADPQLPMGGRVPAGSRPPTSAASPRARDSGQQAALRHSGQHKTVPPPPPPTARVSQQMPIVKPTEPPTQPVHARGRNKDDSGQLAWDEDELETQIYDNPEEDIKNRAARGSNKSGGMPAISHGAAPPSAAAVAAAAVAPGSSSSSSSSSPLPVAGADAAPGAGPDLSSLVSTARGWDGPRPSSPTGSPTNGSSVSPPPSVLATGPHQAPAEDPLAALAATYSAQPAIARDLPAPRLSPPEPLFDPMASFGSGMLARGAGSGRKGKGTLWIAVGGAAVAVVAVVVVIAMTGGDTKQAPAASGTDTAAESGAVAAVAGDQDTGFDLYVVPAGTFTWRLDGEARTDRLPSRIRGIAPGQHTVAIDAPPGFMSANLPITVEAGKAQKVEIVLQPLDIVAEFASDPPGAMVSLIVDGKRETLGPSPATAKLDPRKTYQVLFEKQGFVSINRPIVFTGTAKEAVAVVLEKAGGSSSSSSAAAAVASQTPVTRPEQARTPKTTPATTVAKAEPRETRIEPTEKKAETSEKKVESTPAAAKGQGTLLLGSKPPCDIYINGKDTGLQTPQRDIKLSSGKHKITLVNNEFGIKETFVVDIKADTVEKQIKDYSDRIPK
jgi:eukaryotic-like serine/threonine-protein kinase